MDTVCFYHANCADGFCAAWVVKKQLPNTELIPVQYGQQLPDVSKYKGNRVYIVDFSYSPAEMEVIAKDAVCVVMLDHHKTAIDKWKDQPLIHDAISLWWKGDCGFFPYQVRIDFDESKSGAMLAWKWFDEGRPPKIVQYVQDRDLWQWKLPYSREINAWLATVPKNFESWEHACTMLEHPPSFLECVTSGEAILRREQSIVESAVRNAVERTIAGYVVPVVNSATMQSEIGNELCKGKPFAAIYFDDLKRNVRVWSLRSCEGGLDVSEIAKKFGGGGHVMASGFSVPLV